MSNYKIFQIKISDEVHDFVNSKGAGHMPAAAKYPEYEAHLDQYKGFEGWDDSKFQYYTQVCEVKVDGGLVNEDGTPFLIDSLNKVMKIHNYGYHNEDAENPNYVHDAHVCNYNTVSFTRGNGEFVTYNDMHSLSVGDIVQDPEGKFHIVDRWGFKEILKDQEAA